MKKLNMINLFIIDDIWLPLACKRCLWTAHILSLRRGQQTNCIYKLHPVTCFLGWPINKKFDNLHFYWNSLILSRCLFLLWNCIFFYAIKCVKNETKSQKTIFGAIENWFYFKLSNKISPFLKSIYLTGYFVCLMNSMLNCVMVTI